MNDRRLFCSSLSGDMVFLSNCGLLSSWAANEERPGAPARKLLSDVVFSYVVVKSGLGEFSLGATAFSGPAPDVA
jgi:hypothetical protein